MAEADTEQALTLPQTLKQEREEQGLSLEAVAEKLNLSVEQISNIESAQADIVDLSPFERGYIRNYASLLEVDMQPFADDFPSGTGVGAELQPVQRFSYKVSKPIGSRGWVKKTMTLLLIVLLIIALAKSGINFDTVKQFIAPDTVSSAEMETPTSDNNSRLLLPPQQ